MQKEDKPLKPFMVNTSVIVFENKKIILNPNDTKFIEDLEGYRLKGRSSTGAPIFSDENEHTIDAMNLCILIFEQNHGVLFKDLITTSIYPIEGLNPESIEIVDRRIKVEDKEELIIPFGNNGVIKVMNDNKKRNNSFRRSKF